MKIATNLRALLRYNSGIVWGHTPWLIVVPVAAGMLALFWNMAMASMFTPSRAAQTTEGLAPLLAALLCAHILGVEYRHRIGEITFAKPYAARHILYLRLIAVYLLIAGLLAVMLFVYVAGIGRPFPLGGVLLAGIPSILFLSMLSLMTATLYRQPAAGLAVAGLYWAADVYGGVELHPLLSLQGYAAFLRQEEMAAWWLPGKLLLLGLSVLLYLAAMRLVGRPEGVRTRSKAVRNAALLLAAALLYLYSGALCKVAYGLRHEQEWPNRARIWYRDRLRVYGGLPVARLLGAGFADYVGSARAQEGQDEGAGAPAGPQASEPTAPAAAEPRDSARLRRVVARAPRGRWADHALYALARTTQSLAEGAGLEEAKGLHVRLVSEYPQSAFAAPSLLNLAKIAEAEEDAGGLERAGRRLVERYPATHEAPLGANMLAGALWDGGREADAAALLAQLAPNAQPAERPALWQRAGDLQVEIGEPDQARESYRQALAELAPAITSAEAAAVREGEAAGRVALERGKLVRRRAEIQASLDALGP